MKGVVSALIVSGYLWSGFGAAAPGADVLPLAEFFLKRLVAACSARMLSTDARRAYSFETMVSRT